MSGFGNKDARKITGCLGEIYESLKNLLNWQDLSINTIRSLTNRYWPDTVTQANLSLKELGGSNLKILERVHPNYNNESS